MKDTDSLKDHLFHGAQWIIGKYDGDVPPHSGRQKQARRR
jgi:hypothetical protein